MDEKTILDIEALARERLVAARKKRGLTETGLGETAFPHEPRPRAKINSIFQGRGTYGKAVRLRLGDFCAMCAAVGKNPAQELLLILAKIENLEE